MSLTELVEAFKLDKSSLKESILIPAAQLIKKENNNNQNKNYTNLQSLVI